MKNKEELLGFFLVAVSAASFGFMPIFTKIAYGEGISTYSLLFLRFLVGAVFMFSLLFIKKMPLPSKREIIIYLLLGGLGYVLQSLTFFIALNLTSPSVVSLLLYTYPAMVMIGSAIFLKEQINLQKIISLTLALFGAFTIVGGELSGEPLGMILALMSAVFYSVYILVSSRVVKAGMGVQSSAFIMLGAALVYGGINLFVGFTPPAGSRGLLAVVLIALVSTVLAFWSFFTGMEKTGPSRASLISTLEPVVTVLASVLILSEKLTSRVILGGLLVLMSLFITMIPSKKELEN